MLDVGQCGVLACERILSMRNSKGSKLLVIDVGGTNVKFLATGQKDVVKIPSGPKMTPALMVANLQKAIGEFKYTGVSIGYPGPVVNGRPTSEPHNLGPGWVAFDYQNAFGCPVKIINDAAMQAVGSYEGGRMLFLGLGTGLGSALIVDGALAPMELAHLPYKKGRSYEEYVGARGLKRLGAKKWSRTVNEVVTQLSTLLEADYVVIGGGNARKLKRLPKNARLGSNDFAFLGGFRVWHHAATPPATAKAHRHSITVP